MIGFRLHRTHYHIYKIRDLAHLPPTAHVPCPRQTFLIGYSVAAVCALLC